MIIPFTPSGRWRATMCRASAILNRRERRAVAKPAKRGTGFHEFAVRTREIGREDALAEIPLDAPHRSLCEAVDVDALPIEWASARQEVAFAYDPATDTGRELLAVKDRRYAEDGELRPGEIPGTVDILEITGTPTVHDFKTGWLSQSYDPQIRMYALTVARAISAPEIHTGLIYVDEASRTARIVPGMLDEFALEAEALEVRDLVRVIAIEREEYEQTGHIEPIAGDWCQYCDCRPHCPTYTAAGHELAAGVDGASFLDRVRRECDTPAGLARWWSFLERAPTVLKEIEREVLARAPFEIAGGLTVQKVVTHKRQVKDVLAVRKALEAMGLGLAAGQAIDSRLNTTIAKLENALGIDAPRIIARLIRDGAGIVSTPSESYEAVATLMPRGTP